MNQVYKITNQINGKVYIGITTKGIRHRWSEHKARFAFGERDHKLYLAMRKYGIDNFTCEVLEEVDDVTKLLSLEIAYVEQFNSYRRGYNMTCGGDTVSYETRQKLSKIFKGRSIPWHHKAIATRMKHGSMGGILWKGDHPQLVSYEVKHPNGSTEVIKGLRIFCRKYNLSHNLLLATLNGKQHHHKGFVLLARLNDYPEGEYTQASGSGAHPASCVG